MSTRLIVGLIAGEVRRCSGSIWPVFVAHAVNDALAQGLAVAPAEPASWVSLS